MFLLTANASFQPRRLMITPAAAGCKTLLGGTASLAAESLDHSANPPPVLSLFYQWAALFSKVRRTMIRG
jgi:hypothetical protein